MAVAPTEKSFVHADISRDLYFYGVANEWTTIKAEDFEKVRFYWRVAAGSVTLRNFIARSDKGEAGLFPNTSRCRRLIVLEILQESCWWLVRRRRSSLGTGEVETLMIIEVHRDFALRNADFLYSCLFPTVYRKKRDHNASYPSGPERTVEVRIWRKGQTVGSWVLSLSQEPKRWKQHRWE